MNKLFVLALFSYLTFADKVKVTVDEPLEEGVLYEVEFSKTGEPQLKKARSEPDRTAGRVVNELRKAMGKLVLIDSP